MKERRIIFIVSFLAGIFLSVAILYPLLVDNFKNISGMLIISGAILNFIIAITFVFFKIKENKSK